MSHYTVLVCLKPGSGEDELRDALAPFDEGTDVEPYRTYVEGEPKDHWAVESLRAKDLLPSDDAALTWAEVANAVRVEYGEDDSESLYLADDDRPYTLSTYNPQSKWDWYQVGGRWTGYFPIRAGHVGDPALWRGVPGLMTRPNADAWRCDGGPKSALDLNGLRESKASEAGRTYDAYQEMIAGTAQEVPWSDYIARVDAGEMTIDRARAGYHSQPRIKRLREAGRDSFGFDPESMNVTRATYVERARAAAVPGYATLNLDGQWIEPGRMGWWAMTDATESTRASYGERVNDHIDSLPDDTVLVIVDVHI